jgi:hypothetical protein
LKDIEDKMELSEMDLVNKQLTEQLIEKTEGNCDTRLLEAENCTKRKRVG